MAQNANPPLQPLPASVLLAQELARKNLLCKKGNIRTGCQALDEYVLLGGLERGSVVGVSAEEEEMGMLVSLRGRESHFVGTVADSPTDRAPDGGQCAGKQSDGAGNGRHHSAGECVAPEAADGFGPAALCRS